MDCSRNYLYVTDFIIGVSNAWWYTQFYSFGVRLFKYNPRVWKHIEISWYWRSKMHRRITLFSNMTNRDNCCVGVLLCIIPWWRHQMETFSALLTICAGNSPVPGEFPAQRPVTRSFDVSFDLRPNKGLSKHWWGWWFETPSCQLWWQRNATHI